MATRGRPPSAKTLVDRQLGRNVEHPVIPAGEGFIIPNHSGDLSPGRVDSTPVNNLDPVNKKYVDDSVGADHPHQDVKTTASPTFKNLKIEDTIPILTFKDNNDTGDAASGYQEWRDSNNVRLGFFGNSSSTDDNLKWKNESTGGHILLETTGGGIVWINTDLEVGGNVTTIAPTIDLHAATKKYVDDQFPVTHASTTGKTTDDHHAISHIHDGVDGSGTIAHSDTTGRTTDDHHPQAHTILSHDTTATGAELTALTTAINASAATGTQITVTDSLTTFGGALKSTGLEVREANDGGDTHITIVNDAAAGSTDESASIVFALANNLDRVAKITVEREGPFSSGGTADSSMHFFNVRDGTPTEHLSISQGGDVGVTLGNLTVAGNITSLGIDDNATSNAITIDSSERVGIGTTSPSEKLTIDNGTLLFQNGGGLPFAEIYARDNTATTSTSTTKAQILIFDTDGESNNMTPDHAQDHITVVKAGKYKIDASISIKNSSGAAHVISLEMYKNDGAVVFNNIHAGRTLGTGSDVGNMTMSGIVDLAANDTIEMWITSDSGAARTVTVEDIDFCAIQIGGT